MATWQCQRCFRFYHDFAPGWGGLCCPYCGGMAEDQELIRTLIRDEPLKEDEANARK